MILITHKSYSHSTSSNVCKLHHLKADNYFRRNKRNADLLVAILVSAISIQFENSISNLDTTCHPHFSRAVGARGPGDMCSQFWADQVTLSQPGEMADCAHHITMCPSDFHTFLRPCLALGYKQLRRRFKV